MINDKEISANTCQINMQSKEVLFYEISQMSVRLVRCLNSPHLSTTQPISVRFCKQICGRRDVRLSHDAANGGSWGSDCVVTPNMAFFFHESCRNVNIQGVSMASHDQTF